MPFRWTINPYRGCSSCLCVLHGRRHADPDGRWAHAPARRRAAWAMRSYGTEQGGNDLQALRGAPVVRAHWSSEQSRPTASCCGDGTEVVASADHRFLTNRGWKHVQARRARRDAPAVSDGVRSRCSVLVASSRSRSTTPRVPPRLPLRGRSVAIAQEPEARGLRRGPILPRAGIDGGLVRAQRGRALAATSASANAGCAAARLSGLTR